MLFHFRVSTGDYAVLRIVLSAMRPYAIQLINLYFMHENPAQVRPCANQCQHKENLGSDVHSCGICDQYVVSCLATWT